jgi:hypothetical protein
MYVVVRACVTFLLIYVSVSFLDEQKRKDYRLTHLGIQKNIVFTCTKIGAIFNYMFIKPTCKYTWNSAVSFWFLSMIELPEVGSTFQGIRGGFRGNVEKQADGSSTPSCSPADQHQESSGANVIIL